MAVPKGTRWGVDSFDPITKERVDFVKAKTRETPDFWGRYFGRADSQLQKAEIEVLRKECPGTRLLMAYNPHSLATNALQDKPKNAEREYDRGINDARLAVAAANGLIPAGVWLYANVEPRTTHPVSADWIRGWWDGMRGSPYEFGGIYGNTSSTGHWGYLGKAYDAALEKMPDTFKPPLWAALPFRAKKIPEQIDFEYEPGDPPDHPGASVIWQYAVGWYPYDPKQPEKGARFDTNLATVRAYSAMWKLTPAAADTDDPHARVLETAGKASAGGRLEPEYPEHSGR